MSSSTNSQSDGSIDSQEMKEFKDYETPQKLPAGSPETMQKLALSHPQDWEARRVSVATAQADAPVVEYIEPTQAKKAAPIDASGPQVKLERQPVSEEILLEEFDEEIADDVKDLFQTQEAERKFKHRSMASIKGALQLIILIFFTFHRVGSFQSLSSFDQKLVETQGQEKNANDDVES